MIKYQKQDTPSPHKERLTDREVVHLRRIPLQSGERNLGGKPGLIRYAGLFVTLITVLTFSACLGGTPSRGRGWSGPTATEQRVYLTTAEGKLQALSLSARSRGLIFPGEGEWSFPPGDKARLGSLFSTPAVSNGIVYLASLEGRVYALDAALGIEKWKEPYKIGGEIQASPLVAQGKVFIAATDKIFALDALEGKAAWAQPFQAAGRVWAKPSIDDTEASLFFGTMDKDFYALNASTGNLKWTFKTEGAILTTPLVYKGKIYFGAFDGNLYALNPTAREKGLPFPAQGEWLFKAGDWIWTGPIRDGDTLYFATTRGRVYAINALSGKPVWPNAFEISSSFKSNPVIYKDALIIASEEGRIYSLNLGNGQMKWASPSSLGAAIMADLAISEDAVYIFTQGQTLYALDANTGMQRWGYNLAAK